MTVRPHIPAAVPESDALLVIAGERNGDYTWTERLDGDYPDWLVTRCDTYLSAIAAAARRPFRAILACVDPALPQLENAVAGLREAAGPDTKIILCCRPELEPLARSVAAAGADDYVILPPDIAELDQAFGYGRAAPLQKAALTRAPAVSMEELGRLAELLAHLSDRPRALIDRLAEMVRTALDAVGATVVVEGAVAIDGETVTKPVLIATLEGDDGVIGQISVGPRNSGAYAPAHAEKLKHYASLAAHLLRAAAKQREWRHLSVTDPTSGLPNRRHLHQRLDEILAQAAREHFAVTLLLFDVDDFKTYNDRFGHAAGDEIIRTAGNVFRRFCRSQDVVARYGGDEFAVVFWDPEGPRMPGSKHPDCALDVLDRVQEALRQRDLSHLGPAAEARLTISGGLATYPWDAATPKDLIERADEALLSAKRAGKNRIFLIGQRG